MRKTIIDDNLEICIANNLALHAEIGYKTTRELCVFLLTVRQVNLQTEEEEMTAILSVSDIARLIRKSDAKRSGSIHAELVGFIENMMENNYLKFKPLQEGDRTHLPKTLPVYKSIKKIESSRKSTIYKFVFADSMRSYLKNLKAEFVTLNIPRGIKSRYSLRFFIMAKAAYDRRTKEKQEEEPLTMRVEIAELKRILGIQERYKVFKDFRRWVLEKIKEDINAMEILYINHIEYIRTGKKITHLDFIIEDGDFTIYWKDMAALLDNIEKTGDEHMMEVEKELWHGKEYHEFLTDTQLVALDFMISKKCFADPSCKAILEISGGDFAGLEDVFVRLAWQKFGEVTKFKKQISKADAFVKWWETEKFEELYLGEIKNKTALVKNNSNKAKLLNRRD